MSKFHKNRYYIAFVFCLCLFFIAIITLHSYYNLKAIVEPPSNQWGRTTSLGAEDLYKKKPSIKIDENYAEVLTANKSNFTRIKIDRSTRETFRETFNVKDVESYKVQKFDWDENSLYFIENNSLYFAKEFEDGSYSAKTRIADKVKDFEVINSMDEAILAVALEDGVAIYLGSDKDFKQIGETYKIDKISNLAGVKSNEGIIHIAALAEINSVNFPIYYLTFEGTDWKLRGNVTEVSISESWSINDIDIGIDDTDAYIFYEMAKWDKAGQASKVHNAVVSLESDKVDMKFNRFYVFEEDAMDSNAFLSEPRVIKSQDNQIRLTTVKDTYDKKYSSGFSGYYITMDNGKITDVARITKNHRLASNSASANYKGDTVFVFLDAAGGFNYEAFYTETGKAYYDNALKATREDISIALMDTIPGYVSTFLISFIKFTLYFPAILWFLIIEFFEIRKLRERPKLTYAIGFIIYLIVKLSMIDTYYTELSISQMPPMLVFNGARYIYGIGISVIALLIQKLLKRHNPDMHLITEYIIFAFIDIEYTNLLYATYLV